MTAYENAIKEQQRRFREQHLSCRCGTRNGVSRITIALDEDGIATCAACHYTWCPQLEDLGRGFKP